MGDQTKRLCTGTDGTDTKLIDTPSELMSPNRLAWKKLSGLRPDNIWGLPVPSSDDGNKVLLMHFNGTKWDKENVMPDEYDMVYPVSSNVAIASGLGLLKQLDGSCWKNLLPRYGSDPSVYLAGVAVTLANNRLGMVSGRDYVEIALSGN